jgi:hypothetical protein
MRWMMWRAISSICQPYQPKSFLTASWAMPLLPMCHVATGRSGLAHMAHSIIHHVFNLRLLESNCYDMASNRPISVYRFQR